MNITIDHNAGAVSQRLRRMYEREFPFATSTGINRVVKRAQTRVIEVWNTEFTVRRPAFVNRAAKIKPFSTKETLYAIMRVEPPGGTARADILTKFEERGIKTARSGTLAVPIEARATKSAVIPKALRPRALNLRGSGRVLRGDKGTFLVRSGSGGTIFQRTPSFTRVLYVLQPSVPIGPRLHFVESIRGVVERELPGALRQAFYEAIYSVK